MQSVAAYSTLFASRLCAAVFSGLLCGEAVAQPAPPDAALRTAKATPAGKAWPTQPIKLVVGFGPGTSPDALARLLAEPLSRQLGQPVTVENKPGDAGNAGVQAVVSASDGHTVGLAANGPLTSAQSLSSKLGYKPRRDLAPISLVVSSPLVLVVNSSLPTQSVDALFLHARNQGDALSYGSSGVGSGSHLAMELLRSQTYIRPQHVAFSGFPQVAQAMRDGKIHMALMVPSVAMPLVNEGKLKAMAVTSRERSPVLPDLPTLAESLNLPRYNAEVWNALVAPASWPKPAVDRMNQAVVAALKEPEVQKALAKMGWQAVGSTAEVLSRRMRDDEAVWGGVILWANVKTQ
jgi:tripartite-type tricarboxylate transporter receptor subunit TctC